MAMETNFKIRSLTMTDRNGKQIKFFEPAFGSLTLSTDQGRPVIIRKTWFGIKRIIFPSVEDRIDLEVRN